MDSESTLISSKEKKVGKNVSEGQKLTKQDKDE
jgi:hypothetical protein